MTTEVLPLGTDVVPYGNTSAVCAVSATRNERPAQPGDGTLDRQHGRAGDAQHLAPPAVEPAGDSQRIDELDADETERLLALKLRGEERGNAAGATVGGVVAAPHRGAVGDDRCQCRSDRCAVHVVGRVDANRGADAACQRAAQASDRRHGPPTVTAMTVLRVASP